MKNYKRISILLVVCMILTMAPTTAFADSTEDAAATQSGQGFSDMSGHWASEAVAKWAGLGIVKGDDKGFRPDDSITRAELAVILDNLMDYQTAADNSFSDVKKGAWYEDSLLKANAAGILNGDGAGHAVPNADVTREQAAVMLARAFGVEENTGTATTFKDEGDISKWAKPLVLGMEADQYIGGTGNGNFEPKANITRAQVVTMIDNAVKAYYTEAGTYTENIAPETTGANCVTIIRTTGITIKDAKISGDLIVAEGVGEGDFTLDSTTVEGKLIARGGGENSIHIINGAEVNGRVSIERIDGVVRIVSDGKVIAELDANEDVILEGEFTKVTVGEGASVEVRGQVDRLDVKAKSTLKVTKDGSIGTLDIEKAAEGTNLEMDKAAVVETLNAGADMTTSGEGAPKAVSGSGAVTDKETGKTETPAAGSSGGGGGGSNSGTDKRSVTMVDGKGSEGIIAAGNAKYDSYFYFEGTDKEGAECGALSLGTLSVKMDGTLLGTSDYISYLDIDYFKLLKSYLNTLSTGKHTVEVNVTATDGKVFKSYETIYVIPAEATILYDQPMYGILEVRQYDSGTGTAGASIASGGSLAITSGNKLEIKLIDLPSDKRIKSVLVTESYYDYSNTEDETMDFILGGEKIYYAPQGTVTVKVVTEDIPASLPEISGVEFYLNYNYSTNVYSNKVTDLVPAKEKTDFDKLYVKVLFKDGKTSQFVNYLWQKETTGGTYEDGYPISPNYDSRSLYFAGTDADHKIRVIVSGYDKQSQGSISAELSVTKPLISQSQPTGVTAITTSAVNVADGGLSGTTTDMEYKLTTAAESAYLSCTAGSTTGLAVGAYNVRLKAKPGYAAGSPTTITVSAPNQNQAAPTGLAGVAPTYVYGGGKITGITSLMEYKLLSEPDSNYKEYTEGTTVIAGSYAVRYKARTGYNAGAAATIVVPPFVNANQAAPTGLTTTPTTRATGNDGKINGWTADMEYKLSGSGIYTQCEAFKMNYLYAGTYLVRLKAKTGFNAGADATVVIAAPAAKNDANLKDLRYIVTSGGTEEQSLVDGFDPAVTTYDVQLYGNEYGKTFKLNPYASDPGYAKVTYSAVTVEDGTYTAVLKAEVTAEDGVTKKTYTVNITVERRTGTSSISPNVYSISSDTVPVVTLSLTNRDGKSCSLQSLISSEDSIVIIDQSGATIGKEYYTVDAAKSEITVKKEYFSGKSAGTTQYYFNVNITTSYDDHFVLEVQRFNAPFVTIVN